MWCTFSQTTQRLISSAEGQIFYVPIVHYHIASISLLTLNNQSQIGDCRTMSEIHIARKKLRRIFRTGSSFDAFCLAYFPDIKMKFGSGMNREEKENILLESIDASVVVERIETWIQVEHVDSNSEIGQSGNKDPNPSKTEHMRVGLIGSSLLMVTIVLIFFAIAPSIGYPIESSQSLRMMEIILPVFLGYLSTAMVLLISVRSSQSQKWEPIGNKKLLCVLVYGPVATFFLTVFCVILVYGISNGATETVGIGMPPNTMAFVLAIAVGLLSVSTNMLTYFLFPGIRNG